MLFVIYTIYVDSVVFLRKNPFVVLPYIFYGAIDLFVRNWLPNEFLAGGFWLLFVFLSFCFLEAFTIVAVYRNKKVIGFSKSILALVQEFYGQVLLLTVYVCLSCVLFAVIIRILSIPFQGLLSTVIFIVLWFGAALIGFRHSILYNNHFVGSSIVAGLKDFYNNFSFYVLVALMGIVILLLPTLISPVSWALSPYFLIASFYPTQANSVNWLGLLLYRIFSCVQSIALTHAFLAMNSKK